MRHQSLFFLHLSATHVPGNIRLSHCLQLVVDQTPHPNMGTAENVSKTRLRDMMPILQTIPNRMGLDRSVVASGSFMVRAWRALTRRGSILSVYQADCFALFLFQMSGGRDADVAFCGSLDLQSQSLQR